jgi:phosphoenolpyruvate synthase/pyruvate phosphate dikinase
MNRNINWVKGISRKEAPIRSELITRGASKYVHKLIGVKNDNFVFYLQNGNGSAYFDSEQIDKMGEKIALEISKNKLFPQKHIKEFKAACQNLISTSKKIGTNNLQACSSKKLKDYFTQFVEAHYLFSPYMMIPIAIEKIITQKVKEKLLKNNQIKDDEDKLEFYLSKLLIPKELPEVNKEMVDFEALKRRIISKERKADVLLKAHWIQYKWLAVYSPSDEPYSLNYFEKKLEQELKSAMPEPKVRNTDGLTVDQVMEELNLEDATKDYLNLLRDYIFLRTYRVEQLSKAYFLIQPLFIEIAKRGKISLYELCLCNVNEIISFLSNKNLPSTNELDKRKKYYLYIVRNGRFKFYSGKKAYVLFRNEIKEEHLDSVITKFKGVPASRGIGKGKVHIILGKEELVDFKDREVLVTIMTNPDFVTVMKKASAIVTDEGGVLCHAAIVSRELGTPCIVGTKIATKILNNGDLINVDAEKGIVDILSKG